MSEPIRYAAYKNSGVEWIGEIPSHWDCQRIKHLFYESDERAESSTDLPLLSVSEYYGVAQRKDKLRSEETLVRAESLEGYKICHIHDLVINIMLAWKSALGVSEYDGIVSPAYCVYRPKSVIHSRYYHYLFRTQLYATVFRQYSTGIIESRLRLYTDKFFSLYAMIPPVKEQLKIASYLDAQCAEIDDIIASAKASIEDYKQWKASVIYEAVTKGLNPDVEMKDSGVEWIGKMPSHWTVCKFGIIASVKSNLVSPAIYPNVPQVSPEDIEKCSGKMLPCQTVEESGVISWNHLFYKGQILYSKIRPRLNKVTIAPFDGLCSADMYPIETSHDYNFVKYMMLADSFVEQVILVTENRVKMPKINQNELGQILVCIPSSEEQKQIATYLDEVCTQIDQLISEKETLIADLESYKKSLIYEVVTGKRKAA